jgi:hypothetical protein
LYGHAGDHAQAVAEVDEWAKGKSLSALDLYDLACVYSLASAGVRQDMKLNSADRNKAAAHYAVRAIDFLTKAEAAGYFKPSASFGHLKKDTDLDPLRDREDFKKLLAEWERKAKGPDK